MAKTSLNHRYDLIRGDLRMTIAAAAAHCNDPHGSWSDKTGASRATVNNTNISLLSLVAQYLELGREAMKVLDKMEEDFRE